VVPASRAACLASATTGTDLANHPPPYQRPIFGLVDDAHKLMAQNALELGVTLHYLEVGIADAGQRGPHTHLAGRWLWYYIIDGQPAGPRLAVIHDSFHAFPQRREP
jgi:hypothetical protein